MRQETITLTYLKFNELNDDQKKKVLDNNRDINVDHDWYENTIEFYTEKLKTLGFYDIKIEFSGFGSQGDGASFTAKHRRGDVIRSNNRHSHSNSITSDVEYIKLLARRISNKLYKDLGKEHDYLLSDEAVIETLEANDYEFNSNTLEIG